MTLNAIERKPRTLSCWGAAILAVAITAAAPGHAASPAAVALSDAVQITAEVVGIDKSDRIVTVVGPRGNVVEIEAGKEVRNFEQIKVGDKIKATYYESVALYLGAPGTQPDTNATEVVGRAEKGEKPGAVLAGAIDVSAAVRGIDRKKRELTLEMPNGNIVTNKVDPSVKAFDTIKVGDSIHARLTRAFAIAVETP